MLRTEPGNEMQLIQLWFPSDDYEVVMHACMLPKVVISLVISMCITIPSIYANPQVNLISNGVNKLVANNIR